MDDKSHVAAACFGHSCLIVVACVSISCQQHKLYREQLWDDAAGTTKDVLLSNAPHRCCQALGIVFKGVRAILNCKNMQ